MNSVRSRRTEILVVLQAVEALAEAVPCREERSDIRARMADVMWDFDEGRAHRDFERAVLEEASPQQNRTLCREDKNLQSRWLSGILRRVAGRSPILAESLFNRAAPTLGESAGEIRKLRGMLANFVSADDPKLASELLLGDTNAPVGSNYVAALLSLRNTDSKLADRVFVQSFSAPVERSFEQWMVMAVYPYAIDLYSTDLDARGVGGQTSTRPASQGGWQSAFVAAALPSVLQELDSHPEGIVLCCGQLPMEKLLQLYERYMPTALPQLGPRVGKLPPPSTPLDDPAVLSDDERAIHAAEASNDPRERDFLYLSAVGVKAMRKDFDGALALSEKIRAPGRKHVATWETLRSAVDEAVTEKDFEKAWRYVLKEEVGRSRVELAGRVIDKTSNPIKARELVEQLARYVDSDRDAASDPYATLGLAKYAGKLDPSWGFERMKIAVNAISQFSFSYSSAIDSSIPADRVWAGQNSLPALGLDTAFAPLGATDFPRALTLAKSIQNEAASALAQLAVCQSILPPRKKR